jgi:hypothetical protein
VTAGAEICEVDVTGKDGELVAKGISTYLVQARDL